MIFLLNGSFYVRTKANSATLVQFYGGRHNPSRNMNKIGPFNVFGGICLDSVLNKIFFLKNKMDLNLIWKKANGTLHPVIYLWMFVLDVFFMGWNNWSRVFQGRDDKVFHGVG